jgi:hypothetical protein
VEQSSRVAVRYVLAKGIFAPDLIKVETLVRQHAYGDAIEALEGFLKKLGVFVSRSTDSVNIRTEWVHALDPKDQERFMGFLRDLLAVREELQKALPDRLVPARDPDTIKVQNLLDSAQEEIRWVEETSRSTEDEFKHGPFTIILTPGAETGMQEAIETLDQASKKIHQKFSKVLYGKVYVRRGLKMKGTYDPSPHASGQVAGSYVAATDTLNLSLYAVPDRDSLKTLIHEFGHRYHTRFLSGDQRERFIELSTVGDIQKTSFPLAERKKIMAEIMDLLREHRKENYPDPDTFLSKRAKLWWDSYPRDAYRKDVMQLVKKFRDDNDDSVSDALEHAFGMYQYGGNLGVVTNEADVRPLHASLYGETSWQENFAESFLAYVLGSSLPEPL